MATKKPRYDDEDPTPAPQPAGGEIAPGCNEPGVLPPSVTGTSHDPKKQHEKSEE